MADMQLVREDGAGRRTILTVRISDAAWEGREAHVPVLEVRQEIDLDRAIPRPRTVSTPAQLRRAITGR